MQYKYEPKREAYNAQHSLVIFIRNKYPNASDEDLVKQLAHYQGLFVGAYLKRENFAGISLNKIIAFDFLGSELRIVCDRVKKYSEGYAYGCCKEWVHQQDVWGFSEVLNWCQDIHTTLTFASNDEDPIAVEWKKMCEEADTILAKRREERLSRRKKA